MADNVVQDLELLVYLTYSFHFTMQLHFVTYIEVEVNPLR